MDSYVVEELDNEPTFIRIGTGSNGEELYRVAVLPSSIPTSDITQELLDTYKLAVLTFIKGKLDLYYSLYQSENSANLLTLAPKTHILYDNLATLYRRKAEYELSQSV